MPHVTEHTPKGSTRSVKPYACESSREKRQQKTDGQTDGQTNGRTDRRSDKRTDRQTHRRIVQNHFSRRFEGCTSQIRFYFEVDVLHDANTSIDMEVTNRGKRHYESASGMKLGIYWLRYVYLDTISHARLNMNVEHK